MLFLDSFGSSVMRSMWRECMLPLVLVGGLAGPIQAEDILTVDGERFDLGRQNEHRSELSHAARSQRQRKSSQFEPNSNGAPL